MWESPVEIADSDQSHLPLADLQCNTVHPVIAGGHHVCWERHHHITPGNLSTVSNLIVFYTQTIIWNTLYSALLGVCKQVKTYKGI